MYKQFTVFHHAS